VVRRQMYEAFDAARSFSRLVESIHYGDDIVEHAARKWDCSSFVARAVRSLTKVDDVFKSTSLMQITTGVFCAYCQDVPAFDARQLPLLFLYDKNSTNNAQKTVHMGIALPNLAYLRLLLNATGENLKNVISLDLKEVGIGDNTPGLHLVSEWFSATPLEEVLVKRFPGTEPPDFGSARYVVSPAFMPLDPLLRVAAFRG